MEREGRNERGLYKGGEKRRKEYASGDKGKHEGDGYLRGRRKRRIGGVGR